ncbi:flippase [Robiginitalea sp. SC105]|uniref:flippase n=1 Tax=Robiginitalea sp. SC105 TaxID=2762332 RepID=UPI00163A49DC|nr:flippase [Robiginitalea sp. SC105]MBC2838233.1 flippase [Robiginitalea sp. SC105]
MAEKGNHNGSEQFRKRSDKSLSLRSILADSDFREILTKGFGFVLFKAGGMLLAALFTLLVARFYGASVNGLVSLGFTLLLFISVIGRLGIDINLVKFYSEEENLRKHPGLFFRVLAKGILISVVLAIILYFFRDLVAIDLFSKPQFRPYIAWTALSIPLWVITLICSGFLRARKQTNWFAFLNTPGRFLFTLFALLVGKLLTEDPLLAIQAHFVGLVILAILALAESIRQIKRVSFRPTISSWIFLKQAFPMMLSGAIIVFLGWMDIFVLGIFATDDVVGVYNVVLKIATLTSFSLQAINAILMPKVAANYHNGNHRQVERLIQFSTTLNFFLTLLSVAIIILLKDWLLGLFGPEFLTGGFILIILCLGQLANSISGSVGVILQMTGYQKMYQNIVFVALVINILLNVALTPLYGAQGAAIATVISISYWNISGAIIIKRKLNIESFFNPVKFMKWR